MTNLEAIDTNLIKNEEMWKIVSQMKYQQEMNKTRVSICNQVFDVITVR